MGFVGVEEGGVAVGAAVVEGVEVRSWGVAVSAVER